MVEKKVVIMFPAYLKPETEKTEVDYITQFIASLFKAVPGVIVVPLLNGLDNTILGNSRIFLGDLGCSPIITNNTLGLVSVLADGYKYVYNLVPDAVIVRMDVREHPVGEITRLVQLALQKEAMVVGDLVFDETTLMRGSADEVIHKWVFPDMYRVATRREDLGLSCAHGFQIFPTAEVAFEVSVGATKIVDKAGARFGQTVTWGYDGAMVIAASHYERIKKAGIKVVRVEVKAVEARMRDPRKIQNQYINHLENCLASAIVFPD